MNEWIDINSEYYKYYMQDIAPVGNNMDDRDKERIYLQIKGQLIRDMYLGIDTTQSFDIDLY